MALAVVKIMPNYAEFFARGMACIVVKTMPNYAEFLAASISNLFSVMKARSMGDGVGGG